MPPFLASEDALAQFIADFSSGVLPRPEWTHAAHVALCAACTVTLGSEQALEFLRTSIPRYNLSQGVANTPTSGYHETLTCFWAAIIHQCLNRCDPQLPRIEKVRFVVAELGAHRELHKLYYRSNIVASREARSRWIPPDGSLLTYPVTPIA